VLSEYDSLFRFAIGKTDRPQKFGTAVLVKGRIEREVELTSEWDWVNDELARFRGNLVTAEVVLHSGLRLYVCSAYSPAWPVAKERLEGIDVMPVKLKLNPVVWVTEILWAALKNVTYGEVPWIVAGDLNSSVTFDYRSPRGNQEIQDRMTALGYVELLHALQGQLTPTFKNATGGKVIHQMDHLFVTRPFSDRCMDCNIGDASRVLEQSMSDHLPIIGDFNTGPGISG
jgi:endonuclease/exonuclease/phosphatase family metal-dependent hydrolase